MTPANDPPSRNRWIKNPASIYLGFFVIIVTQTVTLTSWLVRMHSDIQNIKVQQEVQDKTIGMLDQTGSRQLPALLGRLEELSAQVIRLDLSGGRKETEIEQQLRNLSDRLAALKEISDSRNKIIDQAHDGFVQLGILQNRMKRVEEDDQRLANEVARLSRLPPSQNGDQQR